MDDVGMLRLNLVCFL